MLKILTVVVALCLFQHTIACCCFRDAWTLPSCGCPETCIVVNASPNPCNAAPASIPCNCGLPTSIPCNCGPPASISCNCGPPVPAPCYRDTCNVCVVYDNPSPVCSCLRSIPESASCGSRCGNPEPCRCGCEEKYIYFPEVEYPTIALDLKPFYYSSCWTV